jgi:hypothetical protein
LSGKSSIYPLGWWKWIEFIEFTSWLVFLMVFLHPKLFWSYKRLSWQSFSSTFWKLQSHPIFATVLTGKRCLFLNSFQNQEEAYVGLFKTKNYDLIFFHDPTILQYICGWRFFDTPMLVSHRSVNRYEGGGCCVLFLWTKKLVAVPYKAVPSSFGPWCFRKSENH